MTAPLLGSLLPRLEVGDQVRFADLPGKWDVVAEAGAGRYTILSSAIADAHTIIDWEIGARGVLGGSPVRDWRTGVRLTGAAAPALSPSDDLFDVLMALESGSYLTPRTVQPLGITHHLTSRPRGPVFDSKNLSPVGKARVLAWLQANGCRWKVCDDQVIRVHGQYVEVKCFTIRRLEQVKTLWPKRIRQDWRPPTKTRRFRIRVPLNTN